jgi:hypothetical protein
VVIAPSLGVSPALMILDGPSGGKLPITPPIPPSSITDASGATNTCDCFTPVGPPIADSDGSIYFEYTVREVSHYFVNSPVSSILWLMKVGPDGTTTNTQLSSSSVANLWPGTIIPDGQGGIVATWVVDNALPPSAIYPYQGAYVSSGIVNTYNLPNAPTTIDRDQNTGLPKYLSLVLGENGTAFISYGANSNISSYNIGSGTSNWNYQHAQPVNFMGYTNGGGITIVDAQSNLIPITATGVAGTALALPSYTSLNPAWDGTWQAQSASLAASIAPIQFPAIDWGHSFWGTQKGNPSQTGTAKENPWFPQLDHCTGAPGCIGHYEAIYNALDDLVARLKDTTVLVGVNKTLPDLAQEKVFNRIGTDINGQPVTVAGFLAFLTNYRPRFYNGLPSTYCADILDGSIPELACFQSPWLRNTIDILFTSVGDKFSAMPKTDALTGTPSNPLLTFLRPTSILFNTLGKNVGNEALIFHEALHGYTGRMDMDLLKRMGDNEADPSCFLSSDMRIDVLQYSPGLDQTFTPCD